MKPNYNNPVTRKHHDPRPRWRLIVLTGLIYASIVGGAALILLALSGVAQAVGQPSEQWQYHDGFGTGYAHAWRSEGLIEPVSPVPPVPAIPLVGDDRNAFEQGYGDGFKKALGEMERGQN